MRARSLAAIGVVAILAAGCSQPAASRSIKPVALLGSVSGPDTSRASLDETVRKAEAALTTTPTDAASAVRLADALMRQARVLGNPGLAIRAEKALRLVLNADPQRYDARRMLATVLLSPWGLLGAAWACVIGNVVSTALRCIAFWMIPYRQQTPPSLLGGESDSALQRPDCNASPPSLLGGASDCATTSSFSIMRSTGASSAGAGELRFPRVVSNHAVHRANTKFGGAVKF